MRSAVVVAVMGLGLATASSCQMNKHKETNATAKHAVIKFDQGNGYVQFVNRDSAPNNVFNIRGVREITLRDDLFIVVDVNEDSYAIPQHRVVYAGIEIVNK
jgi:hypothetical protein